MKTARLDEIIEIAPSLHTAGTFSPRTLRSIARHAAKRQIRYSAETGSGASTLLFSQLSEHHTVFAMDAGSGSIKNVRRCPLLNSGSVTFVEGPTQKTIPQHQFVQELQAALLDGPHAFPFPEIEYYFIYPHLQRGGLLIIDDIHIRSVNNLFRFLSADEMFTLDEVVETTAFFTRTDAPTFDPCGDGWWMQGYNAAPLLRYSLSQQIRGWVPRCIKRQIRQLRRRSLFRHDPNIVIEHPEPDTTVESRGIIKGTAILPPNGTLWLLARRADMDGWWPQNGGPINVTAGRWSADIKYGEETDAGYDFEIAVLIVGAATHHLWLEWMQRAAEESVCAPVTLPSPRYVMDEAFRIVRKVGGRGVHSHLSRSA